MRKRSEIKRAPLRVVDGRGIPGVPEALRVISLTGAALVAEAERPSEFVVPGLLEAGDVALLTGREKEALKTWLMLDVAIARVLGASWLGRPVTRHNGLVLYISPETSARTIARRVRLLCRGRGLTPNDTREIMDRVVVVTEPITFVSRAERERVFAQADLRVRHLALRQNDRDRRKAVVGEAEAAARAEVYGLGANLDALTAIEDAEPGTWALIIVDTLRSALGGDENSSRDAREYTQAARDLARASGAPLISIHHSNKSGDGSDARSSRGSVELTAGPDALLTVDTSGEHPTMFFSLRGHEAPEPMGYKLEAHNDGVRLVTCAPSASKKSERGVSTDDVLEVLRTAIPGEAISASRIREAIAKAKGGAPGSKANPKATQKAIDDAVQRGLACEVQIRPRNGKAFVGYRLGGDDTPDRGRPKTEGEATDV